MLGWIWDPITKFKLTHNFLWHKILIYFGTAGQTNIRGMAVKSLMLFWWTGNWIGVIGKPGAAIFFYFVQCFFSRTSYNILFLIICYHSEYFHRFGLFFGTLIVLKLGSEMKTDFYNVFFFHDHPLFDMVSIFTGHVWVFPNTVSEAITRKYVCIFMIYNGGMHIFS